MFGLEKSINAALKFLEKRLSLATLEITKSIEKLGTAMEGPADAQSRALAKLGKQFEAATQRMEKPTFDVEVDLEPLIVELQSVAGEVRRVAAKPVPDLENIEALLRMILSSIKENAPEKIGEKIDALDVVFKGLKPKESVRFDDTQMKGLMAALTNSGIGTAGGAKSASNWRVATLALTLADTQYSYTFPQNVVSWTFKLRVPGATLYYSDAAGKLPVSGDNSTYMTMLPMGVRSQDGMEWSGKTMYFESDTATQVVEIEIFTL